MNDYKYWDAETGQGLGDYTLRQRYDDMLDEVYGPVQLAGIDYDLSRVLHLADPIAYDCGFNDWLDSELKDGVITDLGPEDD